MLKAIHSYTKYWSNILENVDHSMNLMWDHERRRNDVNHVSLWDGLGNEHHS